MFSKITGGQHAAPQSSFYVLLERNAIFNFLYYLDFLLMTTISFPNLFNL